MAEIILMKMKTGTKEFCAVMRPVLVQSALMESVRNAANLMEANCRKSQS